MSRPIIIVIIIEHRRRKRRKRAAVRAEIRFRNPNQRSSTAMAQLIPSGETAVADVAFFDINGNVTTPASIPAWSSSDEAVATAEASADGFSVSVVPVAVGVAQIQVSADARFGPEVRTITGIADIEVIPAEAVTAAITFRAPPAP